MATAARDETVFPALLRAARGAYSQRIAASLTKAGFDDLPRNGPFVLGGMANDDEPAVRVIRGLGVSRQAASQLIDTLVLRGYLTRAVNADDRRRMDVELTDRGRSAAGAVGKAIKQVDHQLAERLSPTQLRGLRAGLTALAEIEEHAS